MLTFFAVLQAGINVGMVLALFLILRERRAMARLAAAREERLEALAAEFCTLGRAVAEAGRVPDRQPPLRERPVEPAPPPVNPPASPTAPHCSVQGGRPVAAEASRQRAHDRTSSGAAAASPVGSNPLRAPGQEWAEPEGAAASAPERLKAAAALLDRGLSVATVAARTAIPEGEIQVLRNLRKARAEACASGRRLGAGRQRQGLTAPAVI